MNLWLSRLMQFFFYLSRGFEELKIPFLIPFYLAHLIGEIDLLPLAIINEFVKRFDAF
jgi:hypothetical protein